MTEAFDDLERSERLTESAETSPPVGREAAIAALHALLEEWGEQPRAESVVGLLEQGGIHRLRVAGVAT